MEESSKGQHEQFQNKSLNNSNLVNGKVSIPRRDTLQFALPMSFVGIMTVLGICGNLLVLVIFGRKTKKRTYTIFIIGLAIADFMVCTVTLPFEMYEIRHTFNFHSGTVCKIFRTINYMFVFWSTIILILLSVDRYRRVCQPIKIQVSQKTAKTLVLFAFVLSALLALPQVFLQGLQVSEENGKIVHQCAVDEKYRKTMFSFIYHQMLMIISILNLLTIIILYVFIGRKVFKHVRYRRRFQLVKSSTSKPDEHNAFRKEHIPLADQSSVPSSVGRQSVSSHRESESSFKITKIALTIGTAFVLSYVPSVVLSLVEACKGNHYMDDFNAMSLGLIIVAERAFIINHVVNPFIYGFLDIYFRNVCKQFITGITYICRTTEK